VYIEIHKAKARRIATKFYEKLTSKEGGMAKNKLTFEEALAGLEKSATDMIKSDITLEEAIGNFEKGMDYYNKCNEILENAKQKISTYGGKYEK
jgi:exodeoxyribonuclease VII small subunit